MLAKRDVRKFASVVTGWPYYVSPHAVRCPAQ
jgi:hypothetical protein